MYFCLDKIALKTPHPLSGPFTLLGSSVKNWALSRKEMPLLAWTPLPRCRPCGEQRSGRASSAAAFGRSSCIDAAQMVTWPTSWTSSWLQPHVAAAQAALIPHMSWRTHLGRCATPRLVAWRILPPKRHMQSRVGRACQQLRLL